ncbi:MAG: hypothetical protein MI757_04620 [Pirellulales bacterium]|nr:hypothetical protein [Pirellulales bacterium]
MDSIHDQLSQFNAFARATIARQNNELTLDELWDRWRLENPTTAEADEDLLAVRAAVNDMNNGDRGVPAREHIDAMRKKYGLPASA